MQRLSIPRVNCNSHQIIQNECAYRYHCTGSEHVLRLVNVLSNRIRWSTSFKFYNEFEIQGYMYITVGTYINNIVFFII